MADGRLTVGDVVNVDGIEYEVVPGPDRGLWLSPVGAPRMSMSEDFIANVSPDVVSVLGRAG